MGELEIKKGTEKEFRKAAETEVKIKTETMEMATV